MMKKKTVRLWEWPARKGCEGCFFRKDGKCSCPDLGVHCVGIIFREEKPEPEFIDVEIDE